jgi:predicted protein tyrosine phosphatase
MLAFVPSFVSVTVAPGTAAPAPSVTVPVTREVVPWAAVEMHMNEIAAKRTSAKAKGFCAIFTPPKVELLYKDS